MKTPFIKSKKGFTIIEVSLVLAIGGLIMLMVFIAWPAVQRNQHDSQRKNSDLSRLFNAITQYTTNNSGKLPQVPNKDNLTVIGIEDGKADDDSNNAAWQKLYNNYLRANNDSFIDPVGTPYSLSVVNCNSKEGTSSAPNAGKTTGEACDLTLAQSPVGDKATLGTAEGTLVDDAYNLQEGTIVIVVGAYCDGETAKAATTKTGGTRKFAIMYGLESGGVYCTSN